MSSDHKERPCRKRCWRRSYTSLLRGRASFRARAWAAAWVSLDEADNDPARFLAYVITSLRKVEPAMGGDALAALQPSAVITPSAAAPHIQAPTLPLNELSALATPGCDDTPAGTSLSPLADPLTEREREVLQLLVAGHTNREIAAELVIAVSTVKSHVNNIYGKLAMRNRSEASTRARELHLL